MDTILVGTEVETGLNVNSHISHEDGQLKVTSFVDGRPVFAFTVELAPIAQALNSWIANHVGSDVIGAKKKKGIFRKLAKSKVLKGITKGVKTVLRKTSPVRMAFSAVKMVSPKAAKTLRKIHNFVKPQGPLALARKAGRFVAPKATRKLERTVRRVMRKPGMALLAPALGLPVTPGMLKRAGQFAVRKAKQLTAKKARKTASAVRADNLARRTFGPTAEPEVLEQEMPETEGYAEEPEGYEAEAEGYEEEPAEEAEYEAEPEEAEYEEETEEEPEEAEYEGEALEEEVVQGSRFCVGCY
jgi:hypothetical protein